MIKSKKQLFIAISLFTIVILVNLPYPHSYTLGANLTLFYIPLNNVYGLNYVGIVSVLLIIIGLVLLFRSLKKHSSWLVFLTIFVVSITPQLIVTAYQNTLATGIYAIEYIPSDSKCKFDMIKEDILQVECELWFINHSKNDVTFTVELIEDDPFGESIKSVSLLNAEKPLEVTIKKKRKEAIIITEEFDVTTLENYVSGGSISYVNIIMRDWNKFREL